MKEPPIFIHKLADVEVGCSIGNGTKIWRWSHVCSGAVIGKNCVIGQGCYIAPTVRIGNNVRIQNNVHLWDGVSLEDNVFIGPSVVFTNVKKPRAFRRGRFEQTIVREGASIGANATIICGIEIGTLAFVGAGAVVTRSVSPKTTVWGVPARAVSFQWTQYKSIEDRDLGDIKTNY